MAQDNGIKYGPIENWGQVPEGWHVIDVPAIAMDSRDRVYLFSRGEHPVLVFDREGNFLTSWGEGVFTRPHGMFIGPDDSIYCVDDGDHTMRKCSPDGKVLMTIGIPGRPSDTGFVRGDFWSVKRGGPPFHRPTSVALSSEGDIYITDGYGNCRVHKFSPNGDLLFSWGEPGSGKGQFYLVHGVCVDREGKVYVGDRLNCRVQIFSSQGEFIDQWPDVYQPNDLYLDQADHIFIAEIGYSSHLPSGRARVGGPPPALKESYARVTVRNLKGEVLASVTGPDPSSPCGFVAPHGVRTDSRGDLYVGEVSATHLRNEGTDPKEYRPLKKFARLS